MHFKRWLTGIVAVPALIYIIGPGPRWLFQILISLAGLVGLTEFYAIACRKLPNPFRWTSFFLALCLFFLTSRGEFYSIPVVIFLWAILPLTLFMFIFGTSHRESIDLAGKSLLGSVYVCLPLSLLIVVDRFPRGNLWIFFLLFVIFASDTGAFYCGKFFGKHKLYPSVSPGKTWEGALGGLLSSMGAALLFALLLKLTGQPSIYRGSPVILGFVVALSVSGQIGDLTESMLKRLYGVKDSGKILPGHGGILDRIDGLLFAIPVLYLYVSFSPRP